MPMIDLPAVTLGPLLMLPPGLWLSLLMLTAATVVWRRQRRAHRNRLLTIRRWYWQALSMLGARIGFVGLYWRNTWIAMD